MKRRTLIFAALLLTTAAGAIPAAAQSETSVTVGAGGVFPPGSTFNGIAINAIQSGFGVIITGNVAIGEFCTVLAGATALGLERNIVIEGKATAGSRTAGNVANFSGTCSIDMGDGTPATVGVPFTAAVTVDANSRGSIGLVIGLTTLPNATVNQGSMTIK